MTKLKIHIGFSKGVTVDVPLVHTIVAAQTRYGKSTLVRGMMQYVPDEFQVVCLDVKDPRDFAGAGVEIPIYIENRTDPLMLKQLLEQESHLWLRREFPELIDLCKEGDPFKKVYERVCARMKEKVHPVVRDRLKVLRLLLKKLVSNMAKIEMSERLELPEKINVMNLSKAPSAIKQLAVYSVVKEVLATKRNVIIVIDELPDFAPQRYRTPSKNMIGQAIRKGGAKGIWLWLSGQTMTGVDKQVLKQAMVWILGHQREINEAKRTLDQIPFKTGLDIRDIMTLPVGYFIVCTDEGAYITYGQPEGIAADLARKVSLGEVSVNEVSEMLRKQFEEVDEDLVWEKKFEEEHRIRKELEKTLAEYSGELKRRVATVKEVENLQHRLEEAEIGMEQLRKDLAKSYKDVERLNFEVKDLRRFKQQGEDADNLRQTLTKFLQLDEVAGPPGLEPGASSPMGGPSITIAEVDERINQRLAGAEPARIVAVDVNERIKELVKNDIVNRLVAKIQSLPEPAKKAALWLHEKKSAKIGDLYYYMYEKAGRIPGNFYANVIKPLENAWLIVNEAGNVRWLLEERLSKELKEVLRNGDVQEIARYLTSLLL